MCVVFGSAGETDERVVEQLQGDDECVQGEGVQQVRFEFCERQVLATAPRG